MPFNTKTSTKSITPFKSTEQKVNSKGFQPVGKQSSVLKVQIPSAQDPAPTTLISHSPSNEENVKPATENLQPLSSPLPITVPVLGKVQERDMRAYEHERQRTKRAAERAVNRARKAAVGGGKRAQSSTREEREAKWRTRGKVEVEVDVGVEAVGKGINVLAGALIEGLSGANPDVTAIARANANAINRVEDRQVSLSDLVVLSQRKARKVMDEDFELVPAVRSVIVMDDMPTQGIHEMELDEPWEHVESQFDNDGDTKKKTKAGKEAEPSYAEIVTAALLD